MRRLKRKRLGIVAAIILQIPLLATTSELRSEEVGSGAMVVQCGEQVLVVPATSIVVARQDRDPDRCMFSVNGASWVPVESSYEVQAIREGLVYGKISSWAIIEAIPTLLSSFGQDEVKHKEMRMLIKHELGSVKDFLNECFERMLWKRDDFETHSGHWSCKRSAEHGAMAVGEVSVVVSIPEDVTLSLFLPLRF